MAERARLEQVRDRRAVTKDTDPEFWFHIQRAILLALKEDDRGRLWGTLADEEIFRTLSLKPRRSDINRNLTATVYRLKLGGTLVLTADWKLGYIHPSERDQEPRLGQVVKARVIGLSSHGGLNLSLKPRAYQAIGDDAQQILTLLEHQPDHQLALTDKSSPAEIKAVLGISKGQFKRAVGHLLKARRVSQVNGKLLLLRGESDD